MTEIPTLTPEQEHALVAAYLLPCIAECGAVAAEEVVTREGHVFALYGERAYEFLDTDDDDVVDGRCIIRPVLYEGRAYLQPAEEGDPEDGARQETHILQLFYVERVGQWSVTFVPAGWLYTRELLGMTVEEINSRVRASARRRHRRFM